MATHGSITEFNSSLEDWKTYVERLEQYFTANDCNGEETGYPPQCVWCGSIPANSEFALPDLPSAKSFTEIVEVMNKHYHPKPSTIVQRYTFNSRSRREGESVSTYVAELRRLATDCEFGDSLNEMHKGSSRMRN